jgi:hypothetical protein
MKMKIGVPQNPYIGITTFLTDGNSHSIASLAPLIEMTCGMVHTSN